jgi:hypothetical protein
MHHHFCAYVFQIKANGQNLKTRGIREDESRRKKNADFFNEPIKYILFNEKSKKTVNIFKDNYNSQNYVILYFIFYSFIKYRKREKKLLRVLLIMVNRRLS